MATSTAQARVATIRVGMRPVDVQKPVAFLIFAADFVLIIFSGLVTSVTYHYFIVGSDTDIDIYAGVSVIAAFVFAIIAHLRGIYLTQHLLSVRWQLQAVAFSWLSALVILAATAFLLKSTMFLSRGVICAFAVVGFLTLIMHRLVWRYALPAALANGQLRNCKVALLSISALDFTSFGFKNLRRDGYDVLRHFVIGLDDKTDAFNVEFGSVLRQLQALDIEEILILLDCQQLAMLPELMQRLRVVPLPVRLLPDPLIADLAARPILSVGGSIAIELQRSPLTVLERIQKDIVDRALALAMVVMFSPLLVMVSFLIKCDSSGPVIFKQSRRGFNGRQFQIWKFRSMSVMENGDSVAQATKHDVRVTRIGRVLRKTSIDELPQLWNVLRGEMSLVGPRPHAVAHDNYYDKLIADYALRHHMKPGLTGWAQVNGLRGETPTIDLMQKRVEHDVWYVNNWSLWLDLRIMMMTATTLIGNRAY